MRKNISPLFLLLFFTLVSPSLFSHDLLPGYNFVEKEFMDNFDAFVEKGDEEKESILLSHEWSWEDYISKGYNKFQFLKMMAMAYSEAKAENDIVKQNKVVKITRDFCEKYAGMRPSWVGINDGYEGMFVFPEVVLDREKLNEFMNKIPEMTSPQKEFLSIRLDFKGDNILDLEAKIRNPETSFKLIREELNKILVKKFEKWKKWYENLADYQKDRVKPKTRFLLSRNGVDRGHPLMPQGDLMNVVVQARSPDEVLEMLHHQEFSSYPISGIDVDAKLDFWKRSIVYSLLHGREDTFKMLLSNIPGDQKNKSREDIVVSILKNLDSYLTDERKQKVVDTILGHKDFFGDLKEEDLFKMSLKAKASFFIKFFQAKKLKHDLSYFEEITDKNDAVSFNFFLHHLKRENLRSTAIKDFVESLMSKKSTLVCSDQLPRILGFFKKEIVSLEDMALYKKLMRESRTRDIIQAWLKEQDIDPMSCFQLEDFLPGGNGPSYLFKEFKKFQQEQEQKEQKKSE